MKASIISDFEWEIGKQVNSQEDMQQLLSQLTGQEYIVINLLFGLADEKEHTLKEIGVRFNVTRERIRQIKHKALCKMRGSPAFKHWSYLPDRQPE